VLPSSKIYATGADSIDIINTSAYVMYMTQCMTCMMITIELCRSTQCREPWDVKFDSQQVLPISVCICQIAMFILSIQLHDCV